RLWHHHGRLAVVSLADPLRPGSHPPSDLQVPHPPGDHSDGAAHRGPMAQAPGRAEAQVAPRAARQEQEGSPLAPRSAGHRRTHRGSVRASAPVRPPSPHPCRTHAAARSDSLRPTSACLACHHGRGVSLVRPPLPDGDRAGQAGETAAALAAAGELGEAPGPAELAQPGEGPDLPGRQTTAGDLQCRRACQPPRAEDAEGGVSRADPKNSSGTAGAGPPTGRAGKRPQRDLGFSPRGSTLTRKYPLSLLQCPFVFLSSSQKEERKESGGDRRTPKSKGTPLRTARR